MCLHTTLQGQRIKKCLHLSAENSSNMPQVTNVRLLTDIGGTQIQIYRTKHGKIMVYNNYEIDAFLADSEVELPFV